MLGCRGISDKQGSTIVMALVVMMLLGVIGSAFAVIVRIEMLTAGEFRDGVAAYYLAEAGAKRAVVELSGNDSWPGIKSWVNLDDTNPATGQYQVKIEPVTGQPLQRKVTAYGKFKDAERQVIVWLTLQSPAPVRIDSWRNF